MMLDRSGSMRGNTRLVEQEPRRSCATSVPPTRRESAPSPIASSFNPKKFTSDQNALLRILRSDLPVTGPTPLWNAIESGARRRSRTREGRKVVLVFSDGGDSPANFTKSNSSIMDVMRDAQQDDVMVYAIGLQTTVLPGSERCRGRDGLAHGLDDRRSGPIRGCRDRR